MQKPANMKNGFALLYGIGVVLFLLWDVVKILSFPATETIGMLITAAQWMLSGMVLVRGMLWKYSWSRCMAAGLIWMLLSAFLQRELFAVEETLLPVQRGVFACFVCAPAACILTENQLKRFLKAFTAVWTTVYAVMSLAGVWAALQDGAIWNANSTLAIRIDPALRRLSLFHYPTVTASYLLVAILMALLGMILAQKRLFKGLYLLACLPMVLCLSLTDGRGAFVSLGAALGMGAAVPLCDLLRKKMKTGWALAVCSGVIACAVLAAYVLLPMGIDAFNGVKKQVQSGVLTSALAEEEAPTQEAEEDAAEAEHRTHSSLGFLSGRQYVWRAALAFLRDEPQYLLTGTSAPLVMRHLEEYLEDAPMQGYMHTHNLFLQILMEGGVIGLGLLLAVLWLFARAAFRLWLDGGQAMWKRLLPIPAVAILIGEMVDYITQLSAGLQVAPLLLLFMGMTLVLGGAQKEKQR